ncbi:MAG: ABC transporter ATP-binding protein [Myxococcota bacterium]|jgi:ABC-type transport system involved in cytochrome bd biosynthesis fused ATPase/permease subunit|nr:ABC transporter ATP-binding protein [Myxococcota bacterium]
MPWPLRWVLEAAQLPSPAEGASLGDDAFLLSVVSAYTAIALALGGSEFVQRLNLGRFTAHLTEDLRAAAVRGSARFGPETRNGTGDLSVRVIGDSARVRSELSGIVLNGSTNAILFIAVTAIMFVVSRAFGYIFLVAGVIALTIGFVASRMIERSARKQRQKEGKYAARLREKIEREAFYEPRELNKGSADRKELRSTRIMTLATWTMHGLIGATMSWGLWLGVHEVRSGGVSGGELFLFVAYALTVHRRMVQVGRQVARTGKLVASTNRLGSLAAQADEATTRIAPPAKPLIESLQLNDVEISSEERGPRLVCSTLEFPAGSRTAVIGPIGSGKSSLLRLIAGREPEADGQILWDGTSIGPEDSPLRMRVGYLPESPTLPRRKLWKHLGLPSKTKPDLALKEELRGIGGWQVARRVSRRLSTRVSSLELTFREARSLALSHLLMADDSSVWVLDGVLEGISKKYAQRRLKVILDRAGQRTVVVSMARVVDLQAFDQVIVMRRGQVVFDGSPCDWKERKSAA